MKFSGTEQTRFLATKDGKTYWTYENSFMSYLDSYIDLLENVFDEDYQHLEDECTSLSDYLNANERLAEAGYTHIFTPEAALLGIESLDDLDKDERYTVVVWGVDGEGEYYSTIDFVTVAELKELPSFNDEGFAYIYKTSDSLSLAEYSTRCYMEFVKMHQKGLEGFRNE